MTRSAHWDVGAYALGALDPEDVERFEEHLAGCWACAAELESLVPIVGLMSTVDISQLEDSPALPPLSPTGASRAGGADAVSDDTDDEVPARTRTVGPFAGDRRPVPSPGRQLAPARRSQRVWASRPLQIAAGFALVATLTGVSFFAGSQWFGGGSVPPQAGPDVTVSAPATDDPQSGVDDPQSGVGGPEVTGEKFSTVDPTTGVEADVVLEEAAWGTQVSFALRRVPGPMQCRLVVLRASGTAEVLSTWKVPESGYGTPQQPAPLLLTAATAAPRDDIDRIQVQAVDQSGVATALVTVPV
ncbi:zf-HC2 domain-containing protein [Solwaraspora sp. WMMD406]|uniref:anti-sigma factor family protein n=1 Tax=Solwaraspora sp. WMMD406 TaxID=3016095 RepID=UPI002415D252|nr:zf-HC2 domain-containing protein [Solwaraspora sp. WMMD406]MDG4766973.1 zf-HC2 domain-containing protein [Solwaraspora sp. WMMD406]